MRHPFSLQLSSFTSIAALLMLCHAPAQANPQALHKLFKQDWQWQMQNKPQFATEVGENRYNHALNDVSPAAFIAEQKHTRKVLQQAKKIGPRGLTGQDLISYQVFLSEKENILKAAHFYPYQVYALSPQAGIHLELVQLVEKMPFTSTRDYQNYLARLDSVPKHVDGLIAQLDASIKLGWLAPKVVIEKLPKQIRQLSERLGHSALGRPAQQIPAELAGASQFQSQIQTSLESKVKPAFAKLAKYVEEIYLPACRESIAAKDLPGGRAYYDFLVRQTTTTDLTAEQIHALGLQEVARIQAQMQTVMKQTGFTGDFKQFVRKLNTEPQFFYSKPEDLLQGYRDIMARAHTQLPKHFGRLPIGKVDVKPVPWSGAEEQGGAYYEPGTPDGSRPGYFVANASKLETRPKWKMETLTLHEAEPGHHFQITIAQEVKGLPEFRRFGWYVAFGEGWALYAESLGQDLGFYTDPYSMFGHLDDELYRAARLVVDTGIHAFGWSRQQAIDYMNNNTANPPDDNVVEIDRYISWPSQALGYKIGQLKIQQLREQAKVALGDQFDLRQFHDVLLGNGGLPLHLVEQQILAWQQSILKTRNK